MKILDFLYGWNPHAANFLTRCYLCHLVDERLIKKTPKLCPVPAKQQDDLKLSVMDPVT